MASLFLVASFFASFLWSVEAVPIQESFNAINQVTTSTWLLAGAGAVVGLALMSLILIKCAGSSPTNTAGPNMNNKQRNIQPGPSFQAGVQVGQPKVSVSYQSKNPFEAAAYGAAQASQAGLWAMNQAFNGVMGGGNVQITANTGQQNRAGNVNMSVSPGVNVTAGSTKANVNVSTPGMSMQVSAPGAGYYGATYNPPGVVGNVNMSLSANNNNNMKVSAGNTKANVSMSTPGVSMQVSGAGAAGGWGNPGASVSMSGPNVGISTSGGYYGGPSTAVSVNAGGYGGYGGAVATPSMGYGQGSVGLSSGYGGANANFSMNGSAGGGFGASTGAGANTNFSMQGNNSAGGWGAMNMNGQYSETRSESHTVNGVTTGSSSHMATNW